MKQLKWYTLVECVYIDLKLRMTFRVGYKCDIFCWFQIRFLAATIFISHTIPEIVVLPTSARGFKIDLHFYPSHCQWKATFSYCDRFTILSECYFMVDKALKLQDRDPLSRHLERASEEPID